MSLVVRAFVLLEKWRYVVERNCIIFYYFILLLIQQVTKIQNIMDGIEALQTQMHQFELEIHPAVEKLEKEEKEQAEAREAEGNYYLTYFLIFYFFLSDLFHRKRKRKNCQRETRS